MKYAALSVIPALLLAAGLVAQPSREDDIVIDPLGRKVVDERGKPALRRACIVDINGDGKDDLILSENVSWRGTGGLNHTIYLNLGKKRYRRVDTVLASTFAVEDHDGTAWLWWYSGGGAERGTVGHVHVDREGVYRKSPALEIHPGDGGTNTGRAIFKAIFNDETTLKFVEVK